MNALHSLIQTYYFILHTFIEISVLKLQAYLQLFHNIIATISTEFINALPSKNKIVKDNAIFYKEKNICKCCTKVKDLSLVNMLK